ncbi:hypothetical protein LPU83_pLPU83a_0017 (plasmid) [Rhizobium favelukesii]|uniref:Uncharacterized protein n=1 Tax=Rhizobium favelukesii TaxID=348824 RepID=W6RLN0_9HYPH|nr:hypothetical protein LPU83_pLPU83a_0017 [Rhizobium favelukesii]
MTIKIATSLRTASWIVLFSAIGFGFVKLGFAVVCWVGGHNLFEAMFGFTTPFILGAAIGIESLFWLRGRPRRARSPVSRG